MNIDIFDQLPGYIGWKDTSLNYLGCNRSLATVLRLKKTTQIIGLSDRDLADHTDESEIFHRENDRLVLLGQTVTGLHQSSGPYGKSLFHFVKKPLLDSRNNISGIIFHCNELKASSLITNLLESDSKLALNGCSQHYRSVPPDNKFKLSNRELECLFYTLRGKSAKQIAEMMSLSRRTIESYLESIKNKTGCHNKADLLVLAVSNGYMNYIPQHLL